MKLGMPNNKGYFVDEIRRILQLLQEYDSARKEYQRLLRAGGWDVTGPQVGVLRIVNTHPGISISELAEKMSIHITTAEGYAQRLSRLGYVTIKEDPGDRRRKIIVNTEMGMSIIKEVPLGYKSLLVHNLAKAGIEERKAIVTGLEYLIQHMKEHN
ncbi:MAG: MarR family transcriptional regulator [Dethiobacter sp.]|nr:MAG: MarR family transcriptional regulator [Dethiobacter sp.]